MKIKKKIIGRLALLVCLMTMICPTEALAKESATLSISTPADTYLVGDNVTVTVSIQASAGITGYDMVVTYDPKILEFQSSDGGAGGGGEIKFISQFAPTQTLTFKAIGAGSAKIAVLTPGAFGVGGDIEAEHNNPSMNLTVSAPPTYSDNNYLSDLKVSAGNLSPVFDTNTMNYSCMVGTNVDRLVVTATPQDSKAKTWVSDTALNYGNNNIAVVVTAENGDERRYQISCTRAMPPQEQTTQAPTEPEKKKVVVNDVIYAVVTDYRAHALPSGYAPKNADVDGATLEIGYSDVTKLWLVYLEMEGGGGTDGFYVYDAASKKFSPYVTAQQPSRQYAILPITNAMEKPAGLVLGKAEIGGRQVDVMTDSANKAYVVFYGVDEEGNAGWFRYCNADGTVQKHVAAVPGDKPTEPQSQKEVVSATLRDLNNGENAAWWRNAALIAGGAVLVLLTLVVVLFRKMRNAGQIEEEYDGREEYDAQEEIPFSEEEEYMKEQEDRGEEESQEQPFDNDVGPMAMNIVHPRRKTAEKAMEPEEELALEEDLMLEEEMMLEEEDDFEFLDFEERNGNR